MRSFGKRVRDVLAATLSAALIISGVALAAPAAYAEEGTSSEVTQTSEQRAETPAPEQKEADAPKEEPKVEAPKTEAPKSEAPKEEPKTETPSEDASESESDSSDDSTEDGSSAQSKGTSQKLARSGMSTLSEGTGAELKVSKTSGLDPEGEEITVTGTGYTIDPASVYAQIGWIVEGEWTPISQTETRAENRAGVKTAWIGGPYQPAWTTAEDGTGSFSWTVTIDQASLDAEKLEGGTLAVFTLGAHNNFVQPDNERFVPISFAEETSSDASATAKVSGVKPGESLSVQVNGSNLPAVGPTRGQAVDVAYVAFIEKGAVIGRDGGYLAMVPDSSVSAGSLSDTLNVPLVNAETAKVQLDRTKKYEVVIWEKHTEVTDETVYARADVKISSAQWDKLLGADPVIPNKPKPKPTTEARVAGSLNWGISSGFAAYTTGDLAEGKISSSGVGKSGGNFLFPQATGSNWDFKTQTGTVRYSGVVTFTGHHGLMSETFANPVIRVNSATSGTISVHGQTLSLNLASASKSIGDGGAVTWRNVPVSGALSGGGGGGGGSFAHNSLSFTVGAASSANFGSTSVTHPSQQKGAANTPPTTDGITILTPEDELVQGGEIEFEADGFEKDERNILVVLYSDQIILDRNAGADEDGKVRWIGTLPDDIDGEHTITLQGSTDAGAVVNILTQEEYDALHADDLEVATDGSGEPVTQAAGPVAVSEDSPVWAYWLGAIGLIVVAAGLTGLVIAQRRRNAGVGA